MNPRPLFVALGLILLASCADRRASTVEAPTKELFLVDDDNPSSNPNPTDVYDIELLRHRATMGQHAEVRELIRDRLAAASATAPDPGRDALRRLTIELALTEGDASAAAKQLTILEGDIDRLGPAASPESRAIVALLYSDLAYRGNYFIDARKWSLRAVSLLEGGDSPLYGDALTTLARSQLALNNPTQALEVLSEANRSLERGSRVEYADLHEALLLKVDVLLALRMASEAIIAAGTAYNGAVEIYGGDSLPHAEALLAVAAASYAAGSDEAARSMLDDAKEIFVDIQAKQPTFPVSERLHLRLSQLSELLSEAESDSSTPSATPPADPSVMSSS